MGSGGKLEVSARIIFSRVVGISVGSEEGGGPLKEGKSLPVGFAGGVPVKEGGAEVSSARLLKSVGAGASVGAAPDGGGEVGVKSPELGGGPLGSPLGMAGKEEVLASARLLNSVGAAGASLGAAGASLGVLLGVPLGGVPLGGVPLGGVPLGGGPEDVGFGVGVPETEGGAVDLASARLVNVKEGKSLGGGPDGFSPEKAPVPLGRGGGVPELKAGRELSAAGAA